jgi:hypothetical protein
MVNGLVYNQPISTRRVKMDISIHEVTSIELGSIRSYDDYESRDIIIHSDRGEVTITLYSKHSDDSEGILRVHA